MFGFLRSIGLKYNAAEIFLPHQIISPLDVHKYISRYPYLSIKVIVASYPQNKYEYALNYLIY